MIALLVPTRGRPVKFKNMINSIVMTTTEPIIIYALIQCEEDVKAYDIENIQCLKGNPKVRLKGYTVNLDAPTVHMWNRLAVLAYDDLDVKNNIFMLGSDDIVFSTPGWDKALIDNYNKLEKKLHVFSLKDSRISDASEHLSTPHPIVTREYLERMGYFLPPIFLHWFCDTWTVDIARHSGAFTHLSDHLLVHDKVENENQIDDTHARLRSRGYARRDRYVNDTCQHLLEAERVRFKEKLAS